MSTQGIFSLNSSFITELSFIITQTREGVSEQPKTFIHRNFTHRILVLKLHNFLVLIFDTLPIVSIFISAFLDLIR